MAVPMTSIQLFLAIACAPVAVGLTTDRQRDSSETPFRLTDVGEVDATKHNKTGHWTSFSQGPSSPAEKMAPEPKQPAAVAARAKSAAAPAAVPKGPSSPAEKVAPEPKQPAAVAALAKAAAAPAEVKPKQPAAKPKVKAEAKASHAPAKAAPEKEAPKRAASPETPLVAHENAAGSKAAPGDSPKAVAKQAAPHEKVKAELAPKPAAAKPAATGAKAEKRAAAPQAKAEAKASHASAKAAPAKKAPKLAASPETAMVAHEHAAGSKATPGGSPKAAAKQAAPHETMKAKPGSKVAAAKQAATGAKAGKGAATQQAASKPAALAAAASRNASAKVATRTVANMSADDAAGAIGEVDNTTASWPKCSTTRSNGHVHFIQDSEGESRCFVAQLPIGHTQPVPLLFWFHESGANATDCGSFMDDEMSLSERAEKAGVGLVCASAQQDKLGIGGQWAIPSKQNMSSGTRCNEGDSPDISYMRAMFKELRKSHGSRIDLNSIFLAGISMGGAFAEYMSVCMNKELGEEHVFSFASHSTGLKAKGDGLPFPHDIWTTEHTWAECPECGYFPFVPEKTNGVLKACLFDNEDDPTPSDPFFYTSSLNLKKAWEELGNKAEVHTDTGGHMKIHSFQQIMECLDDGTGKLLRSEAVQALTRTQGQDHSGSPSTRVFSTLAVVAALVVAASSWN